MPPGPGAAPWTGQVTERAHATVAAERGVSLRIAQGALLPDRLVEPPGLVTIVGNLIGNALDAATGTADPLVEVERSADDTAVVLRVSDSGPGIPAGRRDVVFAEGWSAKEPPAHRKRGIGLPLVPRLSERRGDRQRAGGRPGRRGRPVHGGAVPGAGRGAERGTAQHDRRAAMTEVRR